MKCCIMHVNFDKKFFSLLKKYFFFYIAFISFFFFLAIYRYLQFSTFLSLVSYFSRRIEWPHLGSSKGKVPRRDAEYRKNNFYNLLINWILKINLTLKNIYINEIHIEHFEQPFKLKHYTANLIIFIENKIYPLSNY